MAPFVTIDTSSDLDFHPTIPSSKAAALLPIASPMSSKRTLLLAPPSLASHESALATSLSAFDRSTTDLQMLDRLAAGLVTLPAATYDLVLLLATADGSHAEATSLLDRAVLGRVAESLRPGGDLGAHGGSALDHDVAVRKEAVLAGLVAKNGGFNKPDYGEEGEVVVLRFGKDKKKSSAGPAVAGSVAVRVDGKTTSVNLAPPKDVAPAGVGFVDFSDDFDMDVDDDDDDDELIDEDTLLTEDDLKRPITIPAECAPRAGKRRRACKDCTCGLAERLAAEDAARRADADSKLEALAKQPVKLAADDLNEIDFTVQGKVGSCGNCSLGDAFRCDGCPYRGFPAFAPGEEVRLLNNDIDL